jgi:hypothetical protein
MVTTTFIGRLGNSMFQIAACIGYAKKYGYTWGVPNYQRESSILTHFPNLPRCNDNEKRYNEHQPGHDNDWFDYHEIPNVGPDVNLFGFWQSWKYFDNAKDEVKQVFKLKEYPEYKEYISIHVRRGDYVKHAGSFPPIDDVYLQRAIEVIWEQTGIENFLLFSDDTQWAKDWAAKNSRFNIIVSEGCNEYEDLSKMASCSHHIIANSTFSWWGAWLGHNPDKVVISPSIVRGNWFGHESGVKQDPIDLLPPNWIQIKFR